MIVRRRFERQAVRPTRDGGLDRAPKGVRAIVAGGGIAGLAAATVLSERGVSVTVVERERFLGGRAGAWRDTLADGTPFEMERGFHGFFRQYYNLRELLRRVDPALSLLVPLTDYPLFGPNGARESFSDLPRRAPFNVVELVRRSESLKLTDLASIGARPALAMLAYDGDATYASWDHLSARTYLDSLRFPKNARQMLFDVFSHSFFNPEEGLSAAELLMSFHFYFMGNPEGLVFDVMNDPFSVALWDRFRKYLEGRGVTFLMETGVRRVERLANGATRFVLDRAQPDGHAAIEGELAVLALSVPALARVVDASPELSDRAFRARVAASGVTLPFSVLRLWLDRAVRPDRAAFVGTAGLGILDNISVYERFEGESRAWAERTGGSVVELHAYAVPEDMDEAAVRGALLEQLHLLYPETKDARILEDRFLHRRDCPSFAPGAWASRLDVVTPFEGLCLAGDFVKTPFPTALMERATASGFLAANALLGRYDVREEPLYSVPLRGALAGLSRFVSSPESVLGTSRASRPPRPPR